MLNLRFIFALFSEMDLIIFTGEIDVPKKYSKLQHMAATVIQRYYRSYKERIFKQTVQSIIKIKRIYKSYSKIKMQKKLNGETDHQPSEL